VRSDGLAGTLVADKAYPARVAFAVIGDLLEKFSGDPATRGWEAETKEQAFGGWPPIAAALTECQDPASFDKIIRIQKDLDSTQQILHQTIDNSKDFLLQSRISIVIRNVSFTPSHTHTPRAHPLP